MAKKPPAAEPEKPDPFEWLRPWPVLFGKDVNPKKRAFLTLYAQYGNMSQAAKECKLSRETHYRWMADEQYPEEAKAYCEAFTEAHSIAVATLEGEARRRAVEGVEDVVWFQGRAVGKVRKYSDILLIFLLKGALPNKYKDRIETSPGGAAVDDMSEEQLDAKIAQLARKAGVGRVDGGEGKAEPDLRVDTGSGDGGGKAG